MGDRWGRDRGRLVVEARLRARGCAVDSATWPAGSARTTSPRCARRRASTRSSPHYVTLRNAGGGSQKGLCPFHDEKSPSFHVTPARQFFHCFGCQEGGDVFTFLMKIDGLGFAEAVERLADKYGVQLRREEGDGPRRTGPEGPPRGRLIEANRLAQEFYADQLASPDALVARQFLARARLRPGTRPTGSASASPRATARRCCTHLRQKGFSDEESVAGRAGRDRAVGVRPLPRPPAVADPRRQRRHDRLRRAADLRRRPDRGEVPQHPRDPALQEEPGALRHRPGPPRDRPRRRRRSWSRATPT